MKTIYLDRKESDRIKGVSTALYMRLLPVLNKHKDEVITYPSLIEWEKELNDIAKEFNEEELTFTASVMANAPCSVSGRVETKYKGHKLLYFPNKKVYGYGVKANSFKKEGR